MTLFSHIGFDVKNMDEMLSFYCDNFDLTPKFTLTFSDAYRKLLDDFAGNIPEELEPFAAGLLKKGDRKWLTYLEIAPRQYLEFFYQYEDKEEMPDMRPCYGYQHFSLEVDDIRRTIERLRSNGIEPETPLRLGVEGTWQCWLRDPDGNRFEIMEYTDKSLQLKGNDVI